jgi:type II secretory pathway pseudopilin PulG
MLTITSTRGFTLIETLVATGILITALSGMAQLLVLSAQWSRQSGTGNTALIAAQGKIEALRAVDFGNDPGGAPLTDPTLQPSLGSTLQSDQAPYVDWLDSSGEPVSDLTGAAWTRRWRVSPAGGGLADAIAIEVCVFRRRAIEAEVCLATIRTRHS